MNDHGRSQLALDVLDALLEGCQVIGFDWTYRYINESAATQGQSSPRELIGRTMMACYPGIEETAMFAALRRCMTARVYDCLDNEFLFADGTKGRFELRFVPVPDGVCILSLDITRRLRLEDELRQAQKMEAVGRLAAGVAHDFNNILSVILGYAELIGGDPSCAKPLLADIGEIRTAALRAAELTQQLLAFSRQQILEPRALDLNECVVRMERMLRRLLGAAIELSLMPAVALWNIKADRGQIEQVIMNCVVNARDAMPAGGKLTIHTANVELDGEYASSHHEVQPGAHVMLAITDTGTGIDTDLQSRIFEPFFTTKDNGKGTGLGLAMVFGIVKQSGGHIWVHSDGKSGTTFKLYFPRASGAAEARVSDRPVPASSQGSETILLVEDDVQIRTLAQKILRRSGYVVLEASNAGEALLTCERHPATIDLLLTDMVLPLMSGRQLAERLKPLRPWMRVLFMSGYADETVFPQGTLESGTAFLQKPLTPNALTRKVREVLRSGGQ